jgi:DNA-binding FadR family transcriptional regulator
MPRSRAQPVSAEPPGLGEAPPVEASYDALIRELEAIEQQREALPLLIARRLMDHLSRGGFRPGDRLPSERQLALSLGIGRSAVRDALKPLALLGLLDTRQGNGTFLRSLESDIIPKAIEWGLFLGAPRIRDLFEARCNLEVMVAGLAARRRSDEDLAVLRRELAAMRASAGDGADFTRADMAFHKRLAEASGNQTLVQIMASIQRLLQTWIARVMRNDENYAATLSEHEAILEALERGDAEAARAAMERHVWTALGRLEATLPAA